MDPTAMAMQQMQQMMAEQSARQIEQALVPYVKELNEGQWQEAFGSLLAAQVMGAGDNVGGMPGGTPNGSAISGDSGGPAPKLNARNSGENGLDEDGTSMKTVDGRNLVMRRHQTAAASKRYRQKRKEEREELGQLVDTLHNKVRSLESENAKLTGAEERNRQLEQEKMALILEIERLKVQGGNTGSDGSAPGSPYSNVSNGGDMNGAACMIAAPPDSGERPVGLSAAANLKLEYEAKMELLRQQFLQGMSLEEFNLSLIAGNLPQVTAEVEGLIGKACDLCIRYKVTASMADQMRKFGYCGTSEGIGSVSMPEVLKMTPEQMNQVAQLRLRYMEEVGNLYLERAEINPKLISLLAEVQNANNVTVIGTTTQQLHMVEVIEQLRANLRHEANVRNVLICSVMQVMNTAQKGVLMINAFPGTIDVVGVANSVAAAMGMVGGMGGDGIGFKQELGDMGGVLQGMSNGMPMASMGML